MRRSMALYVAAKTMTAASSRPSTPYTTGASHRRREVPSADTPRILARWSSRPTERGGAQRGPGADRDAVAAQHVADVEDQREDLAVPVLALLVPGALLGLDRHPVLGEHALGEPPDERPGQVERPRDRRLLDHEQAVDVVGALPGVLGHIGHPER